MQGKFRTYRQTTEHGMTEDDGKLQWNHGCNGDFHADSLDVIYMEEERVVHAQHLTSIVRGRCDGSCNPLGAFLCNLPKSMIASGELHRKIAETLESEY
ncbi:MAG: hypothetical protein HYT37_03235 [Candidatus Sungbacteria bacterium]|nr:hypothetical protein [Candidatus Sungbacteria bacterium]